MIINLIRILLFPFALLFGAGVYVRKLLYQIGFYKRTQFDVTTIGVGNLVAGGSGKTPMVAYLGQLLSENIRVGIISRGYGRKTKGFRLVNSSDDAINVGDEPMFYYDKFRSQVPVAVGEDRVLATTEFLAETDAELLLYDDVFQHLPLQCHRYLLLTRFNKPFYNDFLLPTGDLRELPGAASRADAIVVTSTPPDTDAKELEKMTIRINRYTAAPVFFSAIQYQKPKKIHGHETQLEKVLALSGLANARAFINKLEEDYEVIFHLEKGDHAYYSLSELKKLEENHPGIPFVTSEKDAMRLKSLDLKQITASIYVVPIEVEILHRKNAFEELINSWKS